MREGVPGDGGALGASGCYSAAMDGTDIAFLLVLVALTVLLTGPGLWSSSSEAPITKLWGRFRGRKSDGPAVAPQPPAKTRRGESE